MSALANEPRPAARAIPSAVRLTIVSRISSSEGVGRAELIRDLAPLFAHRLSLAEWRQRAQLELSELARDGLVIEHRSRLTLTDTGRRAADAGLGSSSAGPLSWPQERDGRLTAWALGLENASAATMKSLAKPDGLRAAVLQRAYGLPTKSVPSIVKLRSQLAGVALERAFGNKIRAGMGQGQGLSSKAARLLAGHLSRRPRDFGSDGKLIAALAAEHYDIPQADSEALRLAVIRAVISNALDQTPGAARQPSKPTLPLAKRAANDVAPPIPACHAPVVRPDLDGFVAEVMTAARLSAEGWSGNRKAYISNVWRDVRSRAPQWALSEIEFKCMLAEAHRAGRVSLTNADLKDKRHAAEIEQSAITYKNTVWHLIRVED